MAPGVVRVVLMMAVPHRLLRVRAACGVGGCHGYWGSGSAAVGPRITVRRFAGDATLPPGVFMSDMCIFTASQVRTDTLVTNTYIYHVEQRPLKYSMHSRASWRPRLAPPMAPP